MSRVIAVSNRKGGSGKTTTAVNVAAALALKGSRVLLVDADPQGHTTLSYGCRQPGKDLYSMLVDGSEPGSVMSDTSIPGLKIIPASRRLLKFERSLADRKEARLLLRNSLSGLNGDHDYVVIDTPPTVSLLMVSALIASAEVYVPLQAHFLSLEGLAEMVSLVAKINTLYGNGLKIAGVIPTFYRERTNLTRSVIREIRAHFGDDAVLHPVRMSVALAEAPSFGKSIFEYDLKSNGARDYLAVAKQIAGRMREEEIHG